MLNDTAYMYIFRPWKRIVYFTHVLQLDFLIEFFLGVIVTFQQLIPSGNITVVPTSSPNNPSPAKLTGSSWAVQDMGPPCMYVKHGTCCYCKKHGFSKQALNKLIIYVLEEKATFIPQVSFCPKMLYKVLSET